MLFKQGDIFEMSGGKHHKVLFANDDFFICCPIAKDDGRRGNIVCINHPETYSNKGNLEEKYWIKKISPYGGTYQEGREL